MSYERINTGNRAFTTLFASINDTVTTMTLDSGMEFPADGDFLVSIELEIIKVGSITQGTGVCTDLVRGYEGTVAAAHEAGVDVANKLTAGTISMMFDGVDEAIAAVDGKLDKTGGTMTGDIDLDSNELQNASLAGTTQIGAATLTAELDADGQKITNPKLHSYHETVVTSSGLGETTFNVADGNTFKHTMEGAITVILTNPGVSDVVVPINLIIKMHSEATTITWPASVKWPNDTAPNAPEADQVAVYTFFTINDGTRWYGFQAGIGITE